MSISKNTKIILIVVLIGVIVGVIIYSVWNFFQPRYDDIQLNSFGSSDAKLGYDGNIVTSKNGHLFLVNTRNRETHEEFIRSNWVDAMTHDNVIVYTNTDSKTGICHYDPSDGAILSNHEIINDGLFRIDPSLIRLKDTYFLTTTVIIGPINLSDANNFNGYYQIQLHKSTNLIDWEYVTDIYSAYQNLEDVELDAEGNNLRILFEQETFDKGASTIQTMYSTDYGQTWTEPKTLVDNGADNEPASFIKTIGEYWLFFSSDLNHPGGSYETAEAFLLRLDSDLNPIETQKIPLDSNDQILLYQAIIEGEKVTLLYARDYLGRDDLILENMLLSDITENST